MEWEFRMIRLYMVVGEFYQSYIQRNSVRMSNHWQPAFTDEEVMTIYLHGISEGRHQLKAIYRHTRNHLGEWFPKLPTTYQAFVHRVNQLDEMWAEMAVWMQARLGQEAGVETPMVLDSFPVMMAGAARSGTARVAREEAAKGYCASKKQYYYGVKLHTLAIVRPERLPLPTHVRVTPANVADITYLHDVSPHLSNAHLYADLAYRDAALSEDLATRQVRLLTPAKKAKGQTELPLFDRAWSTLVSEVRQPIESLFNWLNETTGLQNASKVRSTIGLHVHVWGRLTAALILLWMTI